MEHHQKLSAHFATLKNQPINQHICHAIKAMPLYKKIESHQWLGQLTLVALSTQIAKLAPAPISELKPKSLGQSLAQSLVLVLDKDKKASAKKNSDFKQLNDQLAAASDIKAAVNILVLFCNTDPDKPHKKELKEKLEKLTPHLFLEEWPDSIKLASKEPEKSLSRQT